MRLIGLSAKARAALTLLRQRFAVELAAPFTGRVCAIKRRRSVFADVLFSRATFLFECRNDLSILAAAGCRDGHALAEIRLIMSAVRRVVE